MFDLELNGRTPELIAGPVKCIIESLLAASIKYVSMSHQDTFLTSVMCGRERRSHNTLLTHTTFACSAFGLELYTSAKS